jgi:succinate-semialdehyde dehydrogenase/glutarate-semialdehyde dehydrogenase
MYSKFGQFIDGKWHPSAGLAEHVYTNSMDLAYKTSEFLETGMVAVNTPFLSSAETPFGGIKQSGYGREGGSVGIKDYLNLKYTNLGISQ